MTTRVNGGVYAGEWFSKDLRFMTVTSTGATFTAGDEGVPDSHLEQVVEVLQTRGTIIMLGISADTVLHVCMDYAQALEAADTSATADTVLEELAAGIDGVAGLSGTVIDTAVGFAVA